MKQIEELFVKILYLIFPDPDDILTQAILNICYHYSKNNNYEIIRYSTKEKMIYFIIL